MFVRRLVLICLCCYLFSYISKAQDIQFSQFYNAQLYQNPAFAGAAHGHRFNAHQRIQWPRLDAKYMTSMFSFDTYSNKHNSGFGIMAFKDWQGGTNLATSEIDLQYAYELHLTRGITVRPGLQIGYVSRSLGYGLTLPEDYNNNGYVGGSVAPAGTKQFIDISSGGIIYSKNLWLGFSAHHMNTPNTSFLGAVSHLPAKFAFTGGYKIWIQKKDLRRMSYLDDSKEISITPTFHYKMQGTSDQLDFGLYGIYDFLIAGFWYRGIPIKHYQPDLTNNEAIVILGGVKFQQFSVTYSYDFTISKLIRAGTGGAHEFNITYVYKKHKHIKPMKRLPCPDFNR